MSEPEIDPDEGLIAEAAEIARPASAPERRPPIWSPSFLAATFMGVGTIAVAPGTWGSFVALPCAAVLLMQGGKPLLLGAAVGLFLVGLWASRRYMAKVRAHDPGDIVVDEVVGQWLTLLAGSGSTGSFIFGFFLFRLFDVLKPWPVTRLDRHVPGAFGVMIDDVAAAGYAGTVLWVLTVWTDL